MATTGIVGDKQLNTTRQAAAIKARTMTPTAATLIRWTGISAMVAGSYYVAVGLFHPVETLAAVTTTRWLIVHALATAMCFFGPLGLVGLYARQVKETGWLGLAGYLLLTLFYALTFPFTFAEALLLPRLAAAAPTVVESYLGMFNGHPGAINLGIIGTVYTLSGLVYILGGLLFGIATIRAGVLPRWAAALLALGTGLSPVASVLPEAHKALVAVPMGLALVWLGYALWSERREHATESVAGQGLPQLRPTAAE
jgi:hypothetical protein